VAPPPSGGARIAACAFDLDDTLCDWSAGIDTVLAELVDVGTAERFRAAVVEHAHLRHDGVLLSRRHWMTVRDPGLFWAAALESGHQQDGEVARLAAAYREQLSLPLFADVIPALDALGNRTRLALLSNAPRALDRARRVGILDRFEVALSAPEARRKPHPDAFDALLGALGLEPQHVVYVGDDPEEDVAGALEHGMHAVWVDRIDSGWRPPAGAHRITSLVELPDLLDRLDP
jgi:putative hydrolase of the HAD superfamily